MIWSLCIHCISLQLEVILVLAIAVKSVCGTDCTHVNMFGDVNTSLPCVHEAMTLNDKNDFCSQVSEIGFRLAIDLPPLIEVSVAVFQLYMDVVTG